MSDPSACASAARQLSEILAQLSSGNATQSWANIEVTAQTLANGLRVRDGTQPLTTILGVDFRTVSSEDNHTALGRTQLPQTLTALLKDALKDSDINSISHPAAVFELLRIGANLCMDHGEIHRVDLCTAFDPSPR